MRDSFIFYRSFYEAIKDLPRDIQGEIYTAIMEYGLYGNEIDSLKPIARSIFTLIKPQIDVNNKRFENGKKGGRKKDGQNTEEKPKPNQTETKPKPKPNQAETKAEPNVNVNVNDKEIVSTNVEPIKKGTNVPKEAAEAAHACEPPARYAKFRQWLETACPYITGHYTNLITEKEFEKLLGRYAAEDVRDIIEDIENRADLRKRYTNLYRTVLNWLGRGETRQQGYGDRQGNGAAPTAEQRRNDAANLVAKILARDDG